jgi:enoyl-CoA hydratase/carnithine racemase
MLLPAPDGPVGRLPAPEAADLLEGVRRGWRDDELGAARGWPLLVVDVTDADPGLDLSAPAGLPLVVVAVDRSGAPSGGAGADVRLAAVRAAAPWVCPPRGLAAGLDELVGMVGRSPQAATTLVQLLRLSGGLSVADAVVAESLAYGLLQAGPEHARWRADRRARSGSRPKPAGPAAGVGEDPAVLVRPSGSGLSITLNRPARRNAYSAEMRDGLVDALAVAAAAGGEVVLDGNGSCFSSGGDLDEFGSLDDPASAHMIRTSRNAGIRLADLAGVTTVVVHGPCFGAGVELPAFAGHVIARPGTTFTLPEMAMGLLPGAGGTVSLPRRIGPARAAWLALSGATLDLATALEWGLVDAVEPAGAAGSGREAPAS